VGSGPFRPDPLAADPSGFRTRAFPHTQICFMALILQPVMRPRVHSAYRLVPGAHWSI
jgi:hypothetical protein